MLQVSEKATEMLKEYFKDREPLPTIRIYLSPGGWSGPSLGMVLDEPLTDDEVFKKDGITYAINKQLYEQVNPIQVDYIETAKGSGYRITSNLQKSCGSCSCWISKRICQPFSSGARLPQRVQGSEWMMGNFVCFWLWALRSWTFWTLWILIGIGDESWPLGDWAIRRGRVSSGSWCGFLVGRRF